MSVREVTKAEFQRLLFANLVEWPPVVFDGKLWGKKVACEDIPPEIIYYVTT